MSDVAYPALRVAPRTGAEQFHVNGTLAGFDLVGFWQWAVSDLASNVSRGVLAEYVVAKVLGVENVYPLRHRARRRPRVAAVGTLVVSACALRGEEATSRQVAFIFQAYVGLVSRKARRHALRVRWR